MVVSEFKANDLKP